MQRNQKWAGLISHASPFLLPPGATVEQVNIHARIPGSLQTRGGMCQVSHTQDGEVRDVYSCLGTQTSTLLSLTSLGELVTNQSPSLEPQTPTGFEPKLNGLPGQVGTNYLWQYQVDGGTVSDLIYVFYGGVSGQSDWEYSLNAESNTCLSPLDSITTGDAKLTQVIGVDGDNLCDYDSNRQPIRR